MRAVVQRVSRSEVRVEGNPIAETELGLLVLVGVADGDTEDDARTLADKIVHLRIFEDDDRKMNLSLRDVTGTLALVSQFTLLGDCRKGRRPSFGTAADPREAVRLFDQVAETATALGVPVVRGQFAAKMSVELVNEGPVTLLLDTRKEF